MGVEALNEQNIKIRNLEVETARVMGWGDVRKALYPIAFGIEEMLWVGQHPTEMSGCEIPRYARDPAAILSALEWLCRDIDGRDFISGIALWCSPTAKAAGYPHEYIIRPGNDPAHGLIHGETLGVCICRAIVALGQTVLPPEAKAE